MGHAFVIDENGRHLLFSSTPELPISCYEDDLLKTDIPWHWRNGFTAGVVTEGSAVINVGAEEFVVEAGDGFFVNYGSLHQFSVNEWVGHCKMHTITFLPEMVGGTNDRAFQDMYVKPLIENYGFHGMKFSGAVAWQKELNRLTEKSWQYVVNEMENYPDVVCSTTSQIIFLLASHAADVSRPMSQKEIKDMIRIKKMLEYIEKNYREDVVISTVAESAGISESECLRCFHSMINTTPIQYLKNYRIRKASELLRTTDMKVVDISIAVGFQDMSYFAKTFRLIKSMTPSEYRNQYSL